MMLFNINETAFNPRSDEKTINLIKTDPFLPKLAKLCESLASYLNGQDESVWCLPERQTTLGAHLRAGKRHTRNNQPNIPPSSASTSAGPSTAALDERQSSSKRHPNMTMHKTNTMPMVKVI